jgi:endonuclease YncB( thermonuclease family)
MNNFFGKAMKNFIDFWKKDIINKLIVLVISVMTLLFLAFLYFLLTIPKDSLFYSAFLPANNAIASPVVTATPMPTPTTQFFPSLTPLPTLTATKAPFTSPSPSAAVSLTPSHALLQATGTSVPLSVTITPISNEAATACIPNAAPETGNVVGVIDGNTIKVLLASDGKVHIVRYIGIVVPKYSEVLEPYGEAAEIKNYNIVFAHTLRMFAEAADKDSAGRLLRYVMVDNTFVNFALVQQGFATAFSTPPNTACDQAFQNAEQTARQSQIGRWAPTPTPPSP